MNNKYIAPDKNLDSFTCPHCQTFSLMLFESHKFQEDINALSPQTYFKNILYYCCPIKPLYTAISSLNPAEIGMISSYFKFQAPH